jgi:putative phosphoesterase
MERGGGEVVLRSPCMKLGIVSDVHCNADGLRLAIEHMGAIDELLCAGDIVYQYRFGNEIIEVLREHGARNVLGNHDLTLLSRDGERARAAPTVRQENLDYLTSQPISIEVDVGEGKKLVMTHGSPIEPYDRYVYPGSKELAELADYAADYLILGHTHYQMAERLGRCLVINPGSAGEARDHRNGRLLTCCVLDTASGELTFKDYEDPRFPTKT